MFGDDALPVILGPNITGKLSITTQNQNYGGCQLLIQKDALLKSKREKVQELTQTTP
jgi:hypothetical protein